MDWVKRNLVFVIVAVVTLLAMGFAGWYSYSGWSYNVTQREEIEKSYSELNTLYNTKPAPGDGKKVNNIALAKEQQQETREFSEKLAAYLDFIPALPGGKDVTRAATCLRAGVAVPADLQLPGKTNVAARDFSAALQESIAALQKDCANSSVSLPPRYKFSFEKQSSLVTFAPGTVEHLAVQLGEVKVICGILNGAKVNSLDGIRRERVPGSPDDMTGPATDYHAHNAVTNELALITPYEITFRSFTPELAAVLNGFASSPFGLIVKGINVEPAIAVAASDPTAPAYGQPVYAPQGYPAGVPNRAILGEEGVVGGGYGSPYGAPGGGRYPGNPYGGGNPYGTPGYGATPYAPAAVAPGAAPKPGPQVFLQEKQLTVTLLVHVVKRLPLQ
jgi:hypothetical protein